MNNLLFYDHANWLLQCISYARFNSNFQRSPEELLMMPYDDVADLLVLKNLASVVMPFLKQSLDTTFHNNRINNVSHHRVIKMPSPPPFATIIEGVQSPSYSNWWRTSAICDL